MKYIIQQQFIPLNDQIWVTKLNQEDEDFLFDTIEDAEVKVTELQESDPTGRKYKAIPSNNTESNSI
jgi:hypothetical protein